MDTYALVMRSLAPVLSYSTWFKSARLGVQKFELLARGSAFFAYRPGGEDPFQQVLVSAHVAAPHRFRHYFQQDWLDHVEDKDCRHVLEFRNRDGTLELAWPAHRSGPGGAFRDKDVPTELETAETELEGKENHSSNSQNCIDSAAAELVAGDSAGMHAFSAAEECCKTPPTNMDYVSYNRPLVRFHPRGYDVAAIRIRDPYSLLRKLGHLPHSYELKTSDEGCAAPAPGSQLGLYGWELTPNHSAEQLDSENKAPLFYVERPALMRTVLPSLRLSTSEREACSGRHMFESREILEWGICGAPVISLPTMRTGDAADGPRLVGILEGRCMLATQLESAPELGRLGAFICVRHIRSLLEDQSDHKASL